MKEAELVDRFELLWEIEHNHKLYVFGAVCLLLLPGFGGSHKIIWNKEKCEEKCRLPGILLVRFINSSH